MRIPGSRTYEARRQRLITHALWLHWLSLIPLAATALFIILRLPWDATAAALVAVSFVNVAILAYWQALAPEKSS